MPHYPPPPIEPPQRPRTNRNYVVISILLLLLIFLGTLLAVVLIDPPTAGPKDKTPAAEPQKSPEAPSQTSEGLRAVFQMTWEETSETDKDAMCWGIETLGREWAEEQLSNGYTDTTLDWEAFSYLMVTACHKR